MNNQLKIAIGVVCLVVSLTLTGAVALDRNYVAPRVAAIRQANEKAHEAQQRQLVAQEHTQQIQTAANRACDWDASRPHNLAARMGSI